MRSLNSADWAEETIMKSNGQKDECSKCCGMLGARRDTEDVAVIHCILAYLPVVWNFLATVPDRLGRESEADDCATLPYLHLNEIHAQVHFHHTIIERDYDQTLYIC